MRKLSKEQVLLLHTQLIEEFSGTDGVRLQPENRTQNRAHAGKLKNETSRAEVMRKKLRTGKADTAKTKLEIKKTAKIHKQGRKAAKNIAVNAEIRHQLNEANEDQNAGGDANIAES